MSDDQGPNSVSRGGEEVLNIFKRGRRLHARSCCRRTSAAPDAWSSVEDTSQRTAARRTPATGTSSASSCSSASTISRRREPLLPSASSDDRGARTRQFAERYVEIEEENNNLANLYVASYQLHSTLDHR